MSVHAIAVRYANAILEEAVAQKVEETVEQDFAFIAEIINASSDLRALFRSPIIEWWRKKNVAIEVLESKVCPLTLKFVVLVVEKGRERYFRSIVEEFLKGMDERRGIMRIGVESAVTMPDTLRESLTATISEKSGKTVVSTYTEDVELVGGMRVTIGDKVFDGSLRTQLDTLHERLSAS
jgi:F-type H+-transporting ATPase subunit delta